MTSAVLQIEDVCRYYDDVGQRVSVLDGVDLTIHSDGESIALVAPSGAGKSTLLHIAALLEKPNQGRVIIDGRDSSILSDRQRTLLRCKEIGFVYQFHHLLPEFTALENVLLPQLIRGRSFRLAKKRSLQLLKYMGLAERVMHRPSQLSGGEKQRVAIIRAVANSPRILLADEPTGNLDPETSEQVFAVLNTLIKQAGLSAVIATHNLSIAKCLDRIVTLKNGHIVDL